MERTGGEIGVRKDDLIGVEDAGEKEHTGGHG